MDNINEQIERIKSLFTEERLYGNLINEGCTSCSEQEMEDELESKGYSVYKRGKTDANCLTTVNSTPHLKCVKDFFDGDSNYSGKYEAFEWKRGCVLHVELSGKKLPFYSSLPNSNISITIFEKGTWKGKEKTFVITVKFSTPFDKPNPVTGFWDKGYDGIKKVQIRGELDDNCKIKQLETVMIEDEEGRNTVSINMSTTIANANNNIIELFRL